MTDGWRDRANVTFSCEKQPATGSRGMVTANNPLGALAGAEMLAAGGNAVDAAVATLFTLTVVEPMMVGFSGGGPRNVRSSYRRHHDGDRHARDRRYCRNTTHTHRPR